MRSLSPCEPNQAFVWFSVATLRSFLVHVSVNGRNLGHPLTPVFMLQSHDFLMRPMKMIRDEGYLLGQQVERVA
jgi:hypothetical protein